MGLASELSATLTSILISSMRASVYNDFAMMFQCGWLINCEDGENGIGMSQKVEGVVRWNKVRTGGEGNEVSL